MFRAAVVLGGYVSMFKTIDCVSPYFNVIWRSGGIAMVWLERPEKKTSEKPWCSTLCLSGYGWQIEC